MFSISRYSFCDFYYFQNASMYAHNFGTCNFTEFDSHKYPASVRRICGSDPKSCPKDCKRIVDKMNNHRCRKGYEKKAQDAMMWEASNKNAISVWKAINVCETTKEVRGSAKTMHTSSLLLIVIVFICIL